MIITNKQCLRYSIHNLLTIHCSSKILTHGTGIAHLVAVKPMPGNLIIPCLQIIGPRYLSPAWKTQTETNYSVYMYTALYTTEIFTVVYW